LLEKDFITAGRRCGCKQRNMLADHIQRTRIVLRFNNKRLWVHDGESIFFKTGVKDVSHGRACKHTVV
jgi:hypothetical protein